MAIAFEWNWNRVVFQKCAQQQFTRRLQIEKKVSFRSLVLKPKFLGENAAVVVAVAAAVAVAAVVAAVAVAATVAFC